jgi:hypothetical protein
VHAEFWCSFFCNWWLSSSFCYRFSSQFSAVSYSVIGCDFCSSVIGPGLSSLVVRCFVLVFVLLRSSSLFFCNQSWSAFLVVNYSVIGSLFLLSILVSILQSSSLFFISVLNSSVIGSCPVLLSVLVFVLLSLARVSFFCYQSLSALSCYQFLCHRSLSCFSVFRFSSLFACCSCLRSFIGRCIRSGSFGTCFLLR